MSKLNELLQSLRGKISGLVNDTNTDAVAEISKELDDIDKEVKAQETDLVDCKNKIVEMVKATIVSKEPPKDANQVETQKTLDEIMIEEANKVVNEK